MSPLFRPRVSCAASSACNFFHCCLVLVVMSKVILSDLVVMLKLCSHHSAVRQLQAIIMQSSVSCQAVIMQLSGSRQAVVRKSSDRCQIIFFCSLWGWKTFQSCLLQCLIKNILNFWPHLPLQYVTSFMDEPPEWQISPVMVPMISWLSGADQKSLLTVSNSTEFTSTLLTVRKRILKLRT
jgi:hypothetical protein